MFNQKTHQIIVLFKNLHLVGSAWPSGRRLDATNRLPKGTQKIGRTTFWHGI